MAESAGSFIPDDQPQAAGSFAVDQAPGSFVPDEPDTAGIKDFVKGNLAKAAAEKAESTSKVKKAETFVEGLEAGWDMSATGLMLGKPDVETDADSGRAVKIASMIGSVAGDVPFMIYGGLLGAVPGAAAGTAIAPGPGTVAGGVIGGEVGANALPSAMRQLLMDHYEKGDITTPGDFLDRLSAATWEAVKGGSIGVATFGAGRYAGKAVTRAGANGLGQAASKTAAEITTMVTANSALEGHLPSLEDIGNAAIVVGGLGASLKVAGRIRKNFVETGELPHQMVERISDDVVLKQEVVAANDLSVKPPNPDAPIDLMDVPPSLLPEKLTEYYNKTSSTYQRAVDDMSPILKMMDQLDAGKLPEGDNPYFLGRNYRGVDSRAVSFETVGTRDFKTNEINGESLNQIYKELPKDLHKAEISPAESAILSRIDPAAVKGKGGQWKKVNAYRVAKRTLELDKRGIETGIDVAAAKKVVSANKAALEPYVKRIQAYEDRALKYYADSGGVAKEELALIKKMNQEQVPFHRLMEDDPFSVKGAKGNSLKKIKGSQEVLMDPEAVSRENVKALIRQAEKNRLYNRLVELQEKAPEGSPALLQKKMATQRPLHVQREEIAKFLQKHGMDETDIPEEALTLFRPMNQSLQKNEFQFKREGSGNREVWQVHKDYAEVLEALNYHPGDVGFLMKFAQVPARTVRVGTVLSGEFILRNIFRDQPVAAIQSKYGQLPFVDMFESVGKMFKNDKQWQEFLSSGGFSGGLYDLKPWLDGDLHALNKETGFMDKAWNVIKHPIHALEVASTMTENIPRFTEFRKSGYVEGDYNSMVRGAMGARDITVDFQRGSLFMRRMSSIVPFAGAQVQGLDRFFREFSDPATRKRASLKAAAYITLPSVTLWYLNRDDSRVQDALSWEKDLFWHIPTDNWEQAVDQRDWNSRPSDLKMVGKNGELLVNNGIVFKVPKPFEAGILFGSLIERALDGFYRQDKNAFKDFDQTLIDVLKPNMLPSIAVGVGEQLSNHSLFLNTELVSPHVEQRLPEERYSHYTSETAKQIAKMVGYAPKIVKTLGGSADKATPLDAAAVIDNYMNVWGGANGKHLVALSDKLLRATGVSRAAEPPAWDWSNVPVIKAFVKKYPTAGSAPVKEFYERYNHALQVFNSLKVATEEKNEARFNEIISEHGNFGSPPPRLNDVYKMLGDANKVLRNLQTSAVGLDGENRDPSQRKQLMTTIWYEMTEMAKSANTIMDEMETKK